MQTVFSGSQVIGMLAEFDPRRHWQVIRGQRKGKAPVFFSLLLSSGQCLSSPSVALVPTGLVHSDSISCGWPWSLGFGHTTYYLCSSGWGSNDSALANP